MIADSGAWVVEQDGSKRLLGPYREASWSPFGRFVVDAGEARRLTPGGTVRWSLARPDVRLPRWGSTRIHADRVFLPGRRVARRRRRRHGDRLLDAEAAERAPVWRSGPRHRLAYATRDGSVRIVDADTGAVVDPDAPESLLETPGATRSPDGRWRVVGWADADKARLHAARPAQADPGSLGRLRPVPLALLPDNRGVVLPTLIAVAQRVDSTHVFWLDTGAEMELEELLEEGPVLLAFYLFDWSPT